MGIDTHRVKKILAGPHRSCYLSKTYVAAKRENSIVMSRINIRGEELRSIPWASMMAEQNWFEPPKICWPAGNIQKKAGAMITADNSRRSILTFYGPNCIKPNRPWIISLFFCSVYVKNAYNEKYVIYLFRSRHIEKIGLKEGFISDIICSELFYRVKLLIYKTGKPVRVVL